MWQPEETVVVVASFDSHRRLRTGFTSTHNKDHVFSTVGLTRYCPVHFPPSFSSLFVDVSVSPTFLVLISTESPYHEQSDRSDSSYLRGFPSPRGVSIFVIH